jgi:acetylglutamate kinase
MTGQRTGSNGRRGAGGTGTTPIRVIKIGGRAQSDPALSAAIATAWLSAPGSLVVVHGGGDEVSALQRALGTTPSFVGGRRITSRQDIELLRMALSGSANKRLVSALVSRGVAAVGLSGEDAALLVATPLDPERLGSVGDPQHANVALVRHLLGGGFLPVISPLSRSDSTSGEATADVWALNVNGDDAASLIAASLDAEELLLVADVAGVMVDGEVLAELTPAGAGKLIADGAASGGMVAKLEAALAALASGVTRVRIGGVAAIQDRTCGTMVARNAAVSRSVA